MIDAPFSPPTFITIRYAHHTWDLLAWMRSYDRSPPPSPPPNATQPTTGDEGLSRLLRDAFYQFAVHGELKGKGGASLLASFLFRRSNSFPQADWTRSCLLTEQGGSTHRASTGAPSTPPRRCQAAAATIRWRLAIVPFSPAREFS